MNNWTRHKAVLCLSLAATVTYGADSTQNLVACSGITNSAERLACFDKAADQAIPPITAAAAGKWSVKVDTNPLDDSKTATLILASSSGTSRMGLPIGLVVRCKSNEIEMYLNWNEYLGNKASVTSRFGDKPASTAYWEMSSDSQGTFSPAPAVHIREMLGVDRLVAQITPYNENPITAVFNLSGMRDSIKPLRDACPDWAKEQEAEQKREAERQAELLKPPVITLMEYDSLSPGISYSAAVAIIGAEGAVISKTAAGNGLLYMWHNADGGMVTALFEDDKLSNKTQANVK